MYRFGCQVVTTVSPPKLVGIASDAGGPFVQMGEVSDPQGPGLGPPRLDWGSSGSGSLGFNAEATGCGPRWAAYCAQRWLSRPRRPS
jgi:hypothetical protein